MQVMDGTGGEATYVDPDGRKARAEQMLSLSEALRPHGAENVIISDSLHNFKPNPQFTRPQDGL